MNQDFNNLPEDLKKQITRTNPDGTDLYDLEYNTNVNKVAIPNRNDPKVIESFSKNRAIANYTGAVQLGKRQERIELRALLSKPEVIDYLNKKGNGEISNDDLSVIDYIPNSRFAYYNKLIKQGLQNGLSKCDIDASAGLWMTEENLAKLKKILTTMFSPNKSGFTLAPSTRSGVKFTCDNGKAKPLFFNPGTVDLPHHAYEQSYNGNRINNLNTCGCSNDKVANDIALLSTHVNEIITKYETEQEFHQDDHIVNEYFGDDVAKLLHWSRDMALTGKVNLKKLMQLTSALHNYRGVLTSSYMLSLADPFKYCQQARLPSTFPLPTAAFSVTRNLSLTTNNKGNVSFVIDPFYLATSNTACAINNNDAMDGTAASAFFLGVDLGQAMPIGFYTRYRLVSAAVRVTFTSSSLTSTGFCTMSVDFDQGGIGAIGAVNNTYSKYGQFSTTENGYFKQTKSVNNGNVMQINFLPVDTSMQDFYQIGSFLNGYIINGYITGAPVGTTVARLDTIFNYEAFVNQTYSDYIPSSANDNNDSVDECKMFINSCSIRKSVTPDDMRQLLPDRHKIDKPNVAPIIPSEPVKIMEPVAKEKIIDKIKEVGKDILNTIVEDKLKEKPISDRFEIFDKIKTKIPPYIKADVFDSGIGSKFGSAAGGAAAGGILGTILGIGSKLLPLI